METRNRNILRPEVGGLWIVYSAVSLAYVIGWMDQIVAIITDKAEALDRFDECAGRISR